MKEESPQPQRAQGLVDGLVAILLIPGDGRAQMGGMDADLVGAAGDQAGLDQFQNPAWPRIGPQAAEAGSGRLPLGTVDADHPLPALEGVFAQGGIHRQLGPRQWAGEEGQIALVDGLIADQPVQVAQGTGSFGQEQAAGGVAVEPVDQFQLHAGAKLTHGLDQPEAETAAAVDRQPGGLVDGQQALVLEKDGRLQTPQQRGRGQTRLPRLRLPHGGDAHQVPIPQPVIRLDPPLVDPHLAAAQDAVDVTAWDALEPRQKEIVDPLTHRRGWHGHELDPRARHLTGHGQSGDNPKRGNVAAWP